MPTANDYSKKELKISPLYKNLLFIKIKLKIYLNKYFYLSIMLSITTTLTITPTTGNETYLKRNIKLQEQELPEGSNVLNI